MSPQMPVANIQGFSQALERKQGALCAFLSYHSHRSSATKRYERTRRFQYLCSQFPHFSPSRQRAFPLTDAIKPSLYNLCSEKQEMLFFLIHSVLKQNSGNLHVHSRRPLITINRDTKRASGPKRLPTKLKNVA